jgi:hypothetical protein
MGTSGAGPSLLECKEKIARTLQASVGDVRIRSRRFNKWGSTLQCAGMWGEREFFAKMIVQDPMPSLPPLMLPTDETMAAMGSLKAAGDQIELEYNATSEAGKFRGPAQVPTAIARSSAEKAIVWTMLRAVSVNDIVKRWQWKDLGGENVTVALFRAGRWLRGIHEASALSKQIVDIDVIERTIPEWVRRRQGNPGYGRMACRVVHGAILKLGGVTSVPVPVAFTHGDFSLPNLLWDRKRGELWIVDFEHSEYRPIAHDLVTIVSNLRVKLINPFIPRKFAVRWERAFWKGYGPIAQELSILVDALASAWLFYEFLPTLSERRGLGKALFSLYRRFMAKRMIDRRLSAAVSL